LFTRWVRRRYPSIRAHAFAFAQIRRFCQLPTAGNRFIDLFFLPAALRGHRLGTEIIEAAEAEAKRKGCSTAVLYTITFQAPGFYERRGYGVLCRIECRPPGHTRICMTKML
jgi:GNAT superfamily N-acetyltransferase